MREINRILCPVDLSDESQQAINHAVVIARWYKSAITALNVCSPMAISSADFALVGVNVPPLLTEDELRDAFSRVEACVESATSGSSDVRVDVLVESGQPARQILERSQSLAADLIVMGTHGVGGFEHLVLGSVTEKVLRKATCPVLTVPPRAHATSKLPYKRILCPVDFSDSSLSALQFAFSLALEGDAELTLVHVLEWPDAAVDGRQVPTLAYRQEVEREVTAKLKALVPETATDWCRPTTRLGHGKAYREILGMATEDNADLIVMGVQGRNVVDLMLFGSTTNQVVRRATCPVLTLRG